MRRKLSIRLILFLYRVLALEQIVVKPFFINERPVSPLLYYLPVSENEYHVGVNDS